MAKRRKRKYKVQSYENGLPRLALLWERWMIKTWYRGSRKAYLKSMKKLDEMFKKLLGPPQ